jgi:hypothetical protein
MQNNIARIVRPARDIVEYSYLTIKKAEAPSSTSAFNSTILPIHHKKMI